jgi:hypothetical protein
VAVQSASCGTLIHLERVGQPHTTRLDPSIVVLDGLGLLIFLVPGIAAFVVDFSTGAIYLPEHPYSPYPPPPGAYPQPATYPQPGGYPSPPAYPPPGPPVPTGASSQLTAPPMTRIDTDPESLTKEKIAAVIRARTGREVNLDAPEVRVIRANNLDDASAALWTANRSTSP